ncbi:DUF5711 family protein [Sedimentibacter sp. MB31-C6]|uniref:DUF5711 family protein n=1 Tax=Sedimentibacter sp. MB31-C6 TaxID=3109366 RepID=UPI002DDD5DFF|nr:DUF5711 family protein [Sedimentibacter sp. MB36-C1]WSI05475.1 DUF5711 family protein [Sedimentibacter sp. MB36-C1]
MKRLILFFIVIIIVVSIFILTKGGDFIIDLQENKKYKIEDIENVNINSLEDIRFFDKGILTFNNQKIIYYDFNGKILWENKNNVFTNEVYVTDKYIFRRLDNSIEIINGNNVTLGIIEFTGEIVSVSRENDKTFVVSRIKDGQNSLYVLDENNEVVVKDKHFNNAITGVSLSDKSEGYALTTLDFNNDTPINTILFNLLDDVELWNFEIKNEVILEISIVNNNVILLGSENIYYYNNNGKLMWKNSVYNKIVSFEIDKIEKRIYILYEQDEKLEMISYNFEGKVMELYSISENVYNIKLFDSKIFGYDNHKVYLFHDSKTDKLYENMDGNIINLKVDNNYIYIILNDEIIKGKIK